MEGAGLIVNKSTLSAFLSRVGKDKKAIISSKHVTIVDQQANNKQGFSMSTGDLSKFI